MPADKDDDEEPEQLRVRDLRPTGPNERKS